jgi:hypothetical protein
MVATGRRFVDAVAEASPPDAALGPQPYADAGSVGLPAPLPIDSVRTLLEARGIRGSR